MGMGMGIGLGLGATAGTPSRLPISPVKSLCESLCGDAHSPNCSCRAGRGSTAPARAGATGPFAAMDDELVTIRRGEGYQIKTLSNVQLVRKVEQLQMSLHDIQASRTRVSHKSHTSLTHESHTRVSHTHSAHI